VTDWDWASHRGRQIHDVLHVVCGYPPTAVGEIGVFAFLAGNILDLGCLVIAVAAVAAHALVRPGLIGLDLSVFSRAFLQGRRTRSMLGVRFEDLFDWSIFDVRESLGIPRHGLGILDGGQRLRSFSFRDLEGSVVPSGDVEVVIGDTQALGLEAA
jgi:ubiquinone biosynthesis protein Coq4